jgi:predicted MFS family arabinose efflux permease
MRAAAAARPAPQAGAGLYLFVIAIVAFLTVVDLFASQAILPSLAERYRVSPAAMGVAANAAALGMAAAALLVALFGARIDRRGGVSAALLLLCVPTILLAYAPNLAVFAALRVAQGLLMATAFSLTLAYLGERCTARAAGGAFAAYVTGNVAANLFGRLLAASVVDRFGLDANFFVFAALNAAGGALALFAIRASGARMTAPAAPIAAVVRHLENPPLAASFAIGFLILFSFIGVFTYVNFVLVRPPFEIARMSLGLVYFVFAPAILTTPLAGNVASRLSPPSALRLGLAAALVGLPLLLTSALPLVLTGMALFAAGTFFAQAAATAHVSRTAIADKGAASGLYLASYFSGGLVGSAVLGAAFDADGWTACIAGVALALVAAMTLTRALVSAHRPHAENAFLNIDQKPDAQAETNRREM